jgi:hypothetical protein
MEAGGSVADGLADCAADAAGEPDDGEGALVLRRDTMINPAATSAAAAHMRPRPTL